MLDFKIDESRCTQCGLCSKECPMIIINGKNGIPEIKEGKESNCIKCQHCLAICPTGALSIFGKNPDDSLPLSNPIPSATEMEQLIKTRRSVRKFKKEEVPAETINKLLQTAAFAPTGHNKNEVLFTVTETKEDLSKVRSLVYDTLKKASEEGKIRPALAMFDSFQNMWHEKGIDVIFRDAPHIIFASAPRKNRNAVPDCVISMSYFELLANSMGIGTLWDGLLKIVAEDIVPDLYTALGIPEDHVVGYMMVYGYPEVKYARSIQSEGLHLNKIKL
ncbi:nitroreductase family protein [Carboxylicivirga sp. A043]|uniref:nitroreductase family protein n=1 Tax=Carboxylicivirga litoralis TaxID=2816963 RepID=UPI0021CB0CAD|nr:nitroreductase family protein [Carboxylicivirga sp. A043]MCU4154355.1 nitroreductase family protein [Carboxylicivirga sp. A043]